MPDLDEITMAKLAREMAVNIRNYQDIFRDFNINEEDFYEITKIPFFQRAKEQYTLEWNSAISTNERVKLISASLLEPGLPVLAARMVDRNEPLAAAIETGKFLARNAGIGDAKAEQKPNDRFVITINLGADSETFNKSIAIDANDIGVNNKQIIGANVK
jgi:hypothetical protein